MPTLSFVMDKKGVDIRNSCLVCSHSERVLELKCCDLCLI